MAGVFGLKKVYTRQRVDNWSESANYGYFGSGLIAPSTRISVVERIDFFNETVSLPGGVTSTRNKLGSFSSSEYGYFCGGNSAPTTELNWVSRIDFSNEVPSSPFTLITSVTEVEGLSSPNYGYLGGGYTVVLTGTISRTDLTTETNSNPGLTLTQGRGQITTVSSSDHGYFCGGYSPSTSSIIDRIDLSSETVVGPPVHGATVQARKDCAGVFTSNYGYICGGPTDSPPILIDRLDFSSDTVSQPGVDLNQKRDTARGVNSLDYGYFSGGYGGGSRVNTIDRIDFSTETTSAATNNLSQVNTNFAAVSGGTKINAKGFKKHITDISGNPISKSYGYFAGGKHHALPPTNDIDRIDFSTETVVGPSVHGANLTQARLNLAAISNSNYGYFAGGSNPGTTFIATIDRIDFSNETTSAPGNDLTEARYSLAAVSSSNYGYFGGGTTGPPNTIVATIDRIDFSNETTSAAGNDLTEARDTAMGVSASNYGYFAGGWGPPSLDTLNRIDFSTETAVGPPVHGANLTEARWNLSAVYNPNYAYFAGGSIMGPYGVCTIDRLDFSNETLAVPSASAPNQLTQFKSKMGAVFNSNYGYFGGGIMPVGSPTIVSTIDRLDFSTETVDGPPVHGAVLTEGAHGLTGLS